MRKMLKGSTKMQIAGMVELAVSVIVMIYSVYLLYDYKTSPVKAVYERYFSNYGTIMLVVAAFQLYKLIIGGYAYKRADYTQSAVPIMINGVILTVLSGVWLYYVISTYSKLRDLHTLLSGYRDPGKMDVVLIVGASLDVICSVLYVISGRQNIQKTVVVNSWGNERFNYNTPPVYPQQLQPQQPQQPYYGDYNDYYDSYEQQDLDYYREDSSYYGYYEEVQHYAADQYREHIQQEEYPQDDENGGI